MSYTLALLVNSPIAYAALTVMIRESKVADQPFIEVHAKDRKIAKILKKEMDWAPDKPFKTDNILAFTERLPQPMKPSDLISGRYKSMFSPRQRANLIRKGEQWRREDRLMMPIIVRQPDKMEISPDLLRDFIENNYKPLLGEFKHPKFFPDDFATTLNLLNGEEDIIPEPQRTLRFFMPFRDIFNTIHGMELLESAGGPPTFPPHAAESTYLMPFEVEHEQYMHLFAFTLADIANRYNGVDWTLIPTGSSSDWTS